jgi:cellulose synthase/poly-beta-1,6-N-acetylglucosamine synthase-like glycosyltransferase
VPPAILGSAFVSYAALITYAIVGPLAWAVFAGLMKLSHIRMRRFARKRFPLPPSPPTVTILIPAKDEGDGIRACLERVLKQDYPNFTVLTVNDRSSDATGDIMDEIAAAHPDKLRALHIRPAVCPPAGWESATLCTPPPPMPVASGCCSSIPT